MNSTTEFLQGYRALDLTDLRGQLCGRILGDLGMEVVKVEPPGGDPTRKLAPFIESPNGARLSAPFAHLNANKASAIVDLSSETGRESFLCLIQKSDVVLESFPAGYLASIGLGYENLAAANSRLVMASVSGFGQSGPRRNFACTDIVALAMSGLLYITGDPSLPPCKPPRPKPITSAACLRRSGCWPRSTAASEAGGATMWMCRYRKLWRPRSIPSDSTPTKVRS